MTKNERLREVREALGLQQNDFGKELGITQGAVSYYEVGKSWPKASILLKMQKRFNVNLAWLETGEGEMFHSPVVEEPKADYTRPNEMRRDIQSIPIYDIEAMAGMQSIFNDNVRILGYMHIPNAARSDGSVIVRGDSMYGEIKSGDTLTFKILNDVISDLVSGTIHLLTIVFQNELMTVVKYVRKGEGWPETIQLASHNPY